MTRMNQGRTLQSFRRLGTDLLTIGSPNTVEREARIRLVDRYNEKKKEFFESYYKDWAAESDSRKFKVGLYERQLSLANVELQIAARKLKEKNEKIMKLLVKTRDFFDPTGQNYRQYSIFYNIVKSLNSILEKTEGLTTKSEDVTALIMAVHRTERLAGNVVKHKDNAVSWKRLKKRLRKHLYLTYYMKISKIRKRYAWGLERVWIENSNRVNEKINAIQTGEKKLTEADKNTIQSLKKYLKAISKEKIMMHESHEKARHKIEKVKKLEVKNMKWAKEHIKRIVVEAIKQKERKSDAFKQFKENSKKLHDYQKELVHLQEKFDQQQEELFTAQTRLQAIKQNVGWEYALAKDTEQLLEEELELFEHFKENLTNVVKGGNLYKVREADDTHLKYKHVNESMGFFLGNYEPNMSKFEPSNSNKATSVEDRLKDRLKLIRGHYRKVKVISGMDAHIDELLARLFVNVQFLENGMQCFSLAELSYIIFKLIKVNAIIDDKAFLTRFTSEMYDREPRRALEFAMFNYSALLGPKFLAKQNTAFFYKMGMPEWNETIDEKMLTFFVQNYGILINLHKDLTKFGITTQGQKPKHDDYLKFAKKAFFRLVDTVADAYINYSAAAKIEQNFEEKSYVDDLKLQSKISKEMTKDITSIVKQKMDGLTNKDSPPTLVEKNQMYNDAYNGELRKNLKSFRDRWSPKLGMEIWKSRTNLTTKLAMGLKLLLFALSCVPGVGIIINVVAKFFLKEYKTEINKFGEKMSMKVGSLFEKVKKKLKRAVRFRHLRTIDAFGVDIQKEYALIDPADVFFMKDLISLGDKALGNPKVTDNEQDPDHFEKKMKEAMESTLDFQGMRVFREDFVTMGLIELSNEDFMDSLKKVITQNVKRETMAEKMKKVLPGPYDRFINETELTKGGPVDLGNPNMEWDFSEMTGVISRRHSEADITLNGLDLEGGRKKIRRVPAWEDRTAMSDPAELKSQEKHQLQQFKTMTRWISTDISENSQSMMFGERDKLAYTKDQKNIFEMDKEPKIAKIYAENKMALPPNWRPTAVDFLKKMLSKVRKDQVRQIKMDKYNKIDDNTPKDDSEKSMVSNQMTEMEYNRVTQFLDRLNNQDMPLEHEDKQKNLMNMDAIEGDREGIVEAYYLNDSEDQAEMLSDGNQVIRPRRYNSLHCLKSQTKIEAYNNKPGNLVKSLPNLPVELEIYIDSGEEEQELSTDSLSLSNEQEDQGKQDDLPHRKSLGIVGSDELEKMRASEMADEVSEDTGGSDNATRTRMPGVEGDLSKRTVTSSDNRGTQKTPHGRQLKSGDLEEMTLEDEDQDILKDREEPLLRQSEKQLLSRTVI